MEQDSYYYVIIDHEKGPKIACGKEDLIDLLHDYDHPKIRTYTKREEAQSYLDSYEDMQTINKSKKPEKVPSPTEGVKKRKESSDSRKNSLLKLNENGLFASRNEEKRTEDTSNEEYDPLNLDALKAPPNSRNVSLAEREREIRDRRPQAPVYPTAYNPQMYEKHAPVLAPIYEKQERSFLDEKREAKPTGIFEFFRENMKDQALAKYKIRPNEQYSLYFDGASKSNPGNAGAGYVIYDSKREKVYTNYMNLGVKTNNQAEYSGLLYGLKSAQNLGIKYLEVYGDSQLIIYQMTGKYQVKKEELKPFNRAAKELERGFARIGFNWVRREENSEADHLSNQGVMAKL